MLDMLDMSDESSTHVNLGRRQSKWEFHIPVSTLHYSLCWLRESLAANRTNRKSINTKGFFNVVPHMCSHRGGWWDVIVYN